MLKVHLKFVVIQTEFLYETEGCQNKNAWDVFDITLNSEVIQKQKGAKEPSHLSRPVPKATCMSQKTYFVTCMYRT